MFRSTAIAVFFCALPAFAQVWYVDKDQTGNPANGTSWATAFTTIQPAIDAAHLAGGGDVWVAEGVYDEQRDVTPYGLQVSDLLSVAGGLFIPEGIGVYGGFTGSETRRRDADPQAHTTVIDASHSANGGPADIVVLTQGSPILDGFRLIGTKAAVRGVNGQESDVHIRACIIEDFTLTAAEAYRVDACVFRRNGNSQVSGGALRFARFIYDSVFEDNVAGQGGAIYQYFLSGSGSLEQQATHVSGAIERCTFRRNSSSFGSAIGIEAFFTARRGNTWIRDCVFDNNSALSPSEGHGTTIINIEGRLHVVGCLFTANESSLSTVQNISDVGMEISHSTFVNNLAGDAVIVNGNRDLFNVPVDITNVIAWNPGSAIEAVSRRGASVQPLTIAGSVIRGIGTPTEPTFVDAANGNFRLAPGSSAIDAGVDYADIPALDLDDAWRWQGAAPDAGAYESAGTIADSDSDGLPDFYEGDGDNDTDSVPNYLDDDSDGDGISDALEGVGNLDWDNDGVPNFLDLDSDNDSVLDETEYAEGLNPYDSDTDGDGLDDHYEYTNGLDGTTADSGTDADIDGLTNAEEAFLGSDPQDNTDPPTDYYVGLTGNDLSGSGSMSSRWRTISYAVDTLRNLAGFRPTVIHIGVGTFEEKVTLAPNITLEGAGIGQTVIQFYNAAESNHGVVIGADNTALHRLTVTVPLPQSSVITLVRAEHAAMDIDRVRLDGKFSPFSTGLFLVGDGSATSRIRRSIVDRLENGIWAIDSSIQIGLNLFSNIDDHAVFIQQLNKGTAPVTPVLGRSDLIGSTGLNRFRNVSGSVVRNTTDGTVDAGLNDWGVYSTSAVSALFQGDVDAAAYISTPLTPTTLVVKAVRSSDSTPIDDAALTVSLTNLGLTATVDPATGLHLLTGIADGTHTLRVSAPGFVPNARLLSVSAPTTVDQVQLVTVQLGGYEALDLNGGGLDASDVQLIINAVLGIATGPYDVNGDGAINATDVQTLINGALGIL